MTSILKRRMPGSEGLALRVAILEQIRAGLQLQLDTISTALAGVKASANEETKSSAGDKYETGRAMVQLEVDKLLVQQVQVMQSIRILQTISPNGQHKAVELGSLISTSLGHFFVSVAYKSVEIKGIAWQPVSLSAPLTQAMAGKRGGGTFTFLGKVQTIFKIE